jgi:hypothetical protein
MAARFGRQTRRRLWTMALTIALLPHFDLSFVYDSGESQ